MKALLVIVLLIVLSLLFRSFQYKQQNHSGTSPKKKCDNDVLGKSRVVLRFQRQPQPVAAISSKPGISLENSSNFAHENEPMNIQVALEYDTSETEFIMLDAEDEAEELCQGLKSENLLAGGFTYEEMDMAVGEVNHPSGNNESQVAEVMYRLQNTECVTQLTAISSEKAARIKDLINLHIQAVIEKK